MINSILDYLNEIPIENWQLIDEKGGYKFELKT